MFIVNCPHCNDYVIIEKINCGIFRHGTFIKNNKQMDPHEKKEKCDYYFENKLIYGCGKPFCVKIDENDKEKLMVEICDYI